MTINFEKTENGYIELDEDERKDIYERLIKAEAKYGFEKPEHPLFENSYSNDEYLFIRSLIDEFDSMYREQNLICPPDNWQEGYSQVPYIHLELVDFNAFTTENDVICIDDKRLKVKTGGPYSRNGKDYFTVYFDVKFIGRLTEFVTSVFYKNNDGRPQQIEIFGNTMTLLKPIFSTTGFKSFSAVSEDTAAKIIKYSLMMIIAHEYAHIANGHIALRKNEKEYSLERDVAFCLEANADDSAIRFMLSYLFYMGAEGPDDYNLRLTLSEFADEWTLMSFSAFLALSWAYRDEDRKWDESTFKNYDGAEHPMYQMRSYNVSSRALNHIYSVLDNYDIGNYRTRDGYNIDKQLADYISSRIADMIRSFEFCLYYRDKPDREVSEMLFREGLRSSELTHLVDKSTSPISFMLEDEYAQKQNEQIKARWSEVRERLGKYKPYSKLFDTI